jgi:hypothetical protein
MVRGGGKPNPAMAAMPWREWPRRLGALPQKRKTASWLRSKWIKPNTSLARATTHAKSELPSDQHSRQPPRPRQDAAVLATVKVRSGHRTVEVDVDALTDLDGACARRPRNSWPGRKNACGAAKPKNGKNED